MDASGAVADVSGRAAHDDVDADCLSNVVLAKARTYYPRERFGEDWSVGTGTVSKSTDLAVWVLAFARTTPRRWLRSRLSEG